jgi:radical SAM protein with 4Fe4S-binding SPASM domain
MTIADVIAQLKKTYELSDPLYLSKFFEEDGEKWLHESLSKLYQPAYHNNYRIVIVQDCDDIHDYDDLPGKAVATLQKFSSQIDISNFFILLLSNNLNIEIELEQARALFSTDDRPIQHYPLNLLPTTIQKTTSSNTFCILPWMHLYVGPDGNVLPCCVGDQQHPVGSIKIDSVDTIVKSNKFNTIRKNMLTGKRSKECSYCYLREDANIVSPRISHNKQWRHIDTSAFSKDGSIDTFVPVYIDIRLNNICNLKCRMCSSYFSSSIAAEEKELFGVSKYSLRNVERKEELAEILEYIPHVEKIYFAGGEPLLAPEHYEILDSLVKCNNTNLEIVYNTNFTNLIFRNNSVTHYWNKFKNIRVGASIDAGGDVAEYIRHGTKWEDIENNLIKIKQHSPHVNFTVTSTVGFMNVISLIQLQQQWHNNNKLDITKFSLSATVSPDYLTVKVLPKHHKLRLASIITDHISWCNSNNAVLLGTQWQDVLNYMMSGDCTHLLSEFKRITKILDDYRNQSFVKVFPEFQDLIYDQH